MSAVTDILLAPDVRPFAISAAIMVALGGIELLTMIVGFSISELIGKDFALETESHSAIGGLFLWINAGRLPLLILLILALGVFAIAGFLLQAVAHSVGTTVPVTFAALAAAALSLPAIRVTSRGIARIIPRDETYVVDEADFIGHVAEVSIGPLDQGERVDALGGGDDVALHDWPPFSSTIVLAITASWSQGNRIQVSWLTSVM